MRLPSSQPIGGCGQLAEARNPMSDTDAHRPEWVQCNDHRRDVTVSHSYRCRGSGGTACDLPAWPVDKHHLDTGCCYRPTTQLWRRMYGDTYVTLRSRRVYRRMWFASDRTAQRAILRSPATRTAAATWTKTSSTTARRTGMRRGAAGTGTDAGTASTPVEMTGAASDSDSSQVVGSPRHFGVRL